MRRDREWVWVLVSFGWFALSVFILFDGDPNTSSMQYVFGTFLSLILWRLDRIDHALRASK